MNGCEFEISDPGPSYGCSEFDTGTLTCQASGTGSVTYTESFNPTPPHSPFEVTENLCAFHLDQVVRGLHSDPSVDNIKVKAAQ